MSLASISVPEDKRIVKCTGFYYSPENRVQENYCLLYLDRDNITPKNHIGVSYSTVQTFKENRDSFVYLDSINVSPQHRGGGQSPISPLHSNGNVLLSATEQEAKNAGFSLMGLLAAKGRDGWFDKRGFSPIGNILESQEGKPFDFIKHIGGMITDLTAPINIKR